MKDKLLWNPWRDLNTTVRKPSGGCILSERGERLEIFHEKEEYLTLPEYSEGRSSLDGGGGGSLYMGEFKVHSMHHDYHL